MISTVTPLRLSPIRGGSLVITGSGFTGKTGGTLDGRALQDFTVVSDTEVHATWPARVTNGRYDFSQDEVDLVIGADTFQVTYVAPVNLRIAQHIENTLAAAGTGSGYFFAWSQPQVVRGKFDVSTRAINGAWPIGVVWLEDETYLADESTANLRVYELPIGIGALMPLADNMEPTAQATLMLADLTRAAFLDISQGDNALSTDVTEKGYGIFPAESGQLIGAQIRLVCRYQHVAQDSTQETFWTNTQ